MSQSRPLPCIDQRLLRVGLILHARTKGFWGTAIRKVQGAWGNHDALLWHEAGAWWVLDAEPPVARLTPFNEWEARMRAGKAQIRFYWPYGARSMDGREAAKWWLRHVNNSPYDRWAFPRLLWRSLIGPWWKSQAGRDEAWWCTESVRAAWRSAAFDPWGENNATPALTEEAARAGRLDDYTPVILPNVNS